MNYTANNFTITIDLNRDETLSAAGVAIMKDRYLLPTEKSPQECFARAACAYTSNQEHAQRMYDYVSRNWCMFATPILTNAGNARGLPISCYLNYCDDSIQGIADHHYENAFLASYGGGIGGDWSSLRSAGSTTSRGNVSTGVISFIKMMDAQMLAFQQGSSRRASYAAYMDISHPEVLEFIEIRTATGSDLNRRCTGTGFHHAVNITDSFMNAVEKGLEWQLIDPHTNVVKKTVDARTLWMDILTKRLETGEPYIHFIDTSNRALPHWLRDKGLRINNSNLCAEIMLPTNKDRTAVCCLSSVNLEYYDEWCKNEMFIQDMMEFLDNTLQYFIDNAPKPMWRAVESALRERSIGLGSMGFFLYLQKKQVPFESPMAIGINKRIFSHIQAEALKANFKLGKERGEASDAEGTGRRFSHMMAIAPNANISVLCGNTSPSIEPYNANAFKQNTMSGTFLIKNKALDLLLQKGYGLSGDMLDEVWSSIIVNGGSVQHLSFMAELHKELFKTAIELDQSWIVEHASVRQEFVCQGQSVNLFLPADVHKNTLHKLHFAAWKKGLKSLYYLRSTAIRKTSTITQNTQIKFEEQISDCIACEG